MSHDQGGGAGGPQQQWDGQWYQSEPEQSTGRGTSPVVVALIVLLAILILALIGAVGYLFLRPGGVAGEQTLQQEATPPPTVPTQAPATETEYTTPPERETVTVTREAPAAPSPRAGSYPTGADSSGWVDNRQARCNAGDPAAMIGRTAQASFSICINPDNGRYYYRGSSGDAGVEIDDPVVTGTYASVTNNNVLYWIDASRMQIYEDGELISNQPMVAFWAG